MKVKTHYLPFGEGIDFDTGFGYNWSIEYALQEIVE